MSDNAFEELRKPGRHAGAWLTLGHPVITELCSLFDFNWILIDLEHGFATEATLLSNMQVVKNENVAIIVRVGSSDAALIQKILDWGAAGIMLPHASNAPYVSDCLSCMRFPPLGKRGYSSSVRSLRFGMDTMNEHHHPIFLAQIETCEALSNLDEIAAIAGVDVLFVGPSDLRLQIAQQGDENLSFDIALNLVIKAARIHGKQTGILARNKAEANKYLHLGFNWIALGSDLSMIKSGFETSLREITSYEITAPG